MNRSQVKGLTGVGRCKSLIFSRTRTKRKRMTMMTFFTITISTRRMRLRMVEIQKIRIERKRLESAKLVEEDQQDLVEVSKVFHRKRKNQWLKVQFKVQKKSTKMQLDSQQKLQETLRYVRFLPKSFKKVLNAKTCPRWTILFSRRQDYHSAQLTRLQLEKRHAQQNQAS